MLFIGFLKVVLTQRKYFLVTQYSLKKKTTQELKMITTREAKTQYQQIQLKCTR